MASADNTKFPRYRFKNIGPIQEANLVLGDLTIIAGRNNTGKTYLVYALYGFLKQWLYQGIACLVDREDRRKTADAPIRAVNIRELAQKILTEGHAVVALDRETLKEERRAMIHMLAHSFSHQGLADVFSSPATAFEDAAFEVELSEDFSPLVGTVDQTTPLALRLNEDSIEITEITEITSTTNRRRLGKYETEVYLAFFYLRFLFPDLLFEPFVLSAERFGISLFYKELDFTRNQLVDMLQELGNAKNNEGGSPSMLPLVNSASSRYALPIKDNIKFTRGIGDLRNRSELYDKKLFNDVRNMMGGYYKDSDNEIEFRSVARKGRSFKIPLYLASSSARELSDLYFYLRCVARKDHLLIIDEPESHLDTHNQRLFARLMARLLQTGVKVLITTHSDYVIKELNNLIMLGQVQDRKEIAGKFQYTEEDVIKPDTVQAYIAEDCSLHQCIVDQYGINMPVFDETIDDINQMANDLYSRLAMKGEV